MYRLAAIGSLACLVAAGLAGDAQAQEPTDETLAVPPPPEAVALFEGGSLDKWVHRDGKPASWITEDGIVTVRGGSGDIKTKDSFPGDFHLHVEFNVPYMPDAQGQARGNSGVYLQGRHELQVLDSYGLKSQDNDCGGIYKQHAPAVNACKPPLQWQTYDIDFKAPVLEDGKVAKKARITVKQNGIVIQDDKEIEPTPGGLDQEPSNEGPLLLQDHGNPVQFRNIWIVPTKP